MASSPGAWASKHSPRREEGLLQLPQGTSLRAPTSMSSFARDARRHPPVAQEADCRAAAADETLVNHALTIVSPLGRVARRGQEDDLSGPCKWNALGTDVSHWSSLQVASWSRARHSNPPPDLAGGRRRTRRRICGGEDGDWSNEHGPRPNPKCNSQANEDETEIHWIAR